MLRAPPKLYARSYLGRFRPLLRQPQLGVHYQAVAMTAGGNLGLVARRLVPAAQAAVTIDALLGAMVL